jgi:MSHA pilin protein MshD
MFCNRPNNQQGFTLIEMIIGIVVFAVAMTMITSVILPRGQQSVDPIYQVRAAKLASSLLNEIQGKAFDENSNLSQGLLRCDEVLVGITTVPCTLASNFGQSLSEGETPGFFDDVDDYHQFTGSPLDNNQSYDDLYSGYSFVVNVIYDGNYDGTSDSLTNAKLITVSVTMPNSESLNFATYRSNY